MDSRAQFEEWYFRRYGKKDLTAVKDHAEFCDCLEVWQASRAAIEVDFPEKISEHNKNENGYVLPHASSYDEAIDDCAEGVMAAGIGIKLRSSDD